MHPQVARWTWRAKYLYKFLFTFPPVIFQIIGFTFLNLHPTIFPKMFLDKRLTKFPAVAPPNLEEKTMGSGVL